jgi:hypothetical protein
MSGHASWLSRHLLIPGQIMSINISWKLNVQVQSGPDLVVANAVQVDAYDRIEAKVAHSTASPPATTTVDVQPGGAGKVKLLLIRSTRYDDDLKYQVDGTTAERTLNDAVFLVGAGSLDLLEDGTALERLVVTNTSGHDVVLEIIVGRSAV